MLYRDLFYEFACKYLFFSIYICQHSAMKAIFSVIKTFLLTALLLTLPNPGCQARMLYGFLIPEDMLGKAAAQQFNQLFTTAAASNTSNYVVAIEKPHVYNDHTVEFFSLLFLVAIIAIFRQSNPVYFRNLFRAFRNPTLSARQLREPLEQNNIANLLLDLFFSVSLGCYIYFALNHLIGLQQITTYGQPIIIGLFILSIIGIYMARFLFLKFTGWAFDIQETMSHYSFNIFLVNKVLGIILLPFNFILAFGQGTWVQVALFISLIIIAILLANRYIRSGNTFRYFLTYSKLHFFLYLCASEILPLVLLIKLFNQWIIT